MSKLKFNLQLIDQSLARDSLAAFVRQAWHIVEPATPLLWNWHLDVLCEYLEAVAAEDGIKRLIINLPPRSGKSLVASILWPTWVWIKNPASRWLFASYAAGLSGKHSVDRRMVITSEWYQQRWPLTLAGDQNQKTEFVNAARGHMLATSLGGTATGKGGEFIVADDLQNPEMAESGTERENVVRFFDETLSTRLDNKRTGRILVIQQRTHQADLTGHLLAQGGWTQLCLPAEFERRTVITLPRSGGQIIKEEGELLWPEREGRAELDAAKLRLGSFGFACQYLQNPIARGGNLFKAEWFGTFALAPANFDLVVQSWDCAFKTGKTNDYSACVTLGIIRERREDSAALPGVYLLQAWRGRVEFAALKRQAIAFYNEWRPAVVLIEDAASGQSILQELRAHTILPIKGIKPDGDKLARAAAATPIFEAGRFRLCAGAVWLQAYQAEMLAFPGGAHDDFVDATVQAITYLRETAEPSYLTFLKALAYPADYPGVLGPSQDRGLEMLKRQIALKQSTYRCQICKLPIGPGSRIEEGQFMFHLACHAAGKPMPLPPPKLTAQ